MSNVKTPLDQISTPSTDGNVLAELERLRAENAKLKAQKGGTPGKAPPITVKCSGFIGEQVKNAQGQLVPGKGTVGVYGLGRFPMSGYANQWMKVFQNGQQLAQFILDNEARLGFKDGQRDETLEYLQKALPVLEQLASIE